MEPVIVVVRHPDFSDEISLHGVEADVISIDLGSDFDTTPSSAEEAREWAESTWADVKSLPQGHPARSQVLEVIAYTVESYFDVAPPHPSKQHGELVLTPREVTA